MILNRRHLVLAAGALALAPRTLVAEIGVGSGTVQTVSDGHLVLPGDFAFGAMPQDELAPILAEFGLSRDEVRPPCNLTLYRDGDRTVLFDAGSGTGFLPTVGQIMDGLDAAGVAPEDITDLVFTHGHPDHLWGLLDDFDEVPFPQARLMIGRVEFDHWTDPATVDRTPADRQSFAVGAKRRLDAVADRIERFGDGDEVVPGVAAVATFGHTPGHMSFEIRNGSDSVMVVGDAIGNDHVAFVRPDWPAGADHDRDMGAATRVALLDRLAAEQMVITGFHMGGGGLGMVERAGDAYRFVSLDQ